MSQGPPCPAPCFSTSIPLIPVGQWIELQINYPATPKTIYIANGYQKSKSSFLNNARVKKAVISTDNGLFFTVLLADDWGNQEIRLNEWHECSEMKLTVKSVYPGEKYQDLCVSGFGINFEERQDFEWQEMQKD